MSNKELAAAERAARRAVMAARKKATDAAMVKLVKTPAYKALLRKYHVALERAARAGALDGQ